MRKTLLIVGALAGWFNAFGQASAFKHRLKDQVHCPPVYFDMGTGINSNGGIFTMGVDVNAFANLCFSAGGGIGWGGKFYVATKYFLQPCHKGWAFGGGVTYATGWPTLTAPMPTVNKKYEKVTVELTPKYCAFLSATRYWQIGTRMKRGYVQLGWSLPLSPGAYKHLEGPQLSEQADAALKMLAPGGFILSIGKSLTGDLRNPSFRG
jgi:hypothetical protein